MHLLQELFDEQIEQERGQSMQEKSPAYVPDGHELTHCSSWRRYYDVRADEKHYLQELETHILHGKTQVLTDVS